MSEQQPFNPRPYDRGGIDAAPGRVGNPVGTAGTAPRARTAWELGATPDARVATRLLTQSFGWMFGGLLLTALVALLIQSNPRFVQGAADLYIVAVVANLGLVFTISLGINRMNAGLALGLFFAYAAVNGAMFGLIFAAYSLPSVGVAFVSTAGMFGAAAAYGVLTKRNLASLGGILSMGLIGLFIALIVNIFLGSGLLGFVISIVGVGLFTALTAYDVQRIATGDLVERLGSVEKAAVMGALRLYLDFINLFLMILRLTGGRR